MHARLLSREYYAFFDLALLLVLVLAFADFAVFLPDWHPHVLHISAPFKKGIAVSDYPTDSANGNALPTTEAY